MAKVNLLNIAKSEGIFSSFVTLPGHKLIYSDANSLEPHVLTQLSKDKNLMKIYGPAATPNCLYLYSGAHMAMFRDEIRAAYNPDNATDSELSAAKKTCSKTRTLLKKIVLMLLYGAWPKRIFAELKLAGYDIKLRDCQQIYEEFWETYSGVKRFEKALLRSLDNNNGWTFNGRGIPITVDEKKENDIINTIVQSSGHMILMRLLLHINTERHARGARMKPYLVDCHDSTCWMFPEEEEELSIDIYKTAYKKLNDEMGWQVKISGDIKIGNNLAEVSLD